MVVCRDGSDVGLCWGRPGGGVGAVGVCLVWFVRASFVCWKMIGGDMSVVQTANRTMGDLIIASVLLTVLGLLGLNGRPQSPTVSGMPPVQVTVIGAAAVPAVQATIYSADWCGPCVGYLKTVRAKLPPDGWLVADSTDANAAGAHVVIEKNEAVRKGVVPAIDALPCTVLRRNGREVNRFVGAVTPDELCKRINNAAE